MRDRQVGYQCHGCEKVERSTRLSTHGLPSKKNKRHLEEDQLDLLLASAAKLGIYNFASPLHPRSIVLRDLCIYYGRADIRKSKKVFEAAVKEGKKVVEGALSTVEGRCKVASDCLHLRRTTGLGIRISISRETDRFTLLLNGALQNHRISMPRFSRLCELRALYLNVYFMRTALSEQGRSALHSKRFPLFNGSLFLLPLGSFLSSLVDGMNELLRVTDFTPYSKVLMPYSRWTENVAVYLARGHNLTALQDLAMAASGILDMTEEELLSPALAEIRLAELKFFGTFRSKEIWLDVFHELKDQAGFYGLSAEEVARIDEEVLRVGDPGPGPRRLLRFVSGRPVNKDVFKPAEKDAIAALDADVLQHFQDRFGVRGTIQGYFQECEASKCIDDLFCANRRRFVPFSGSYLEMAADPNLRLDPEVNAPNLVAKRALGNWRSLFSRYPLVLYRFRKRLPLQLALFDR